MSSKLFERPCKNCQKMFMPYQTKSGRITKKVCKECITEISKKNGQKSAGKKRGTYPIYELKKKVEA